ncbi:MAG: pantoate--beta-alanine ligase [Flavobacterium sp.]|jgi:pantoate--beta-alanine ligase|uniref:pantoate--beta-alanine ligase n=1 Tax=unclassified Flavobacterium TaxID=196869 RepID=UPI000EB001E8|nr:MULTISPECIES: pantoate--beta-alanine ligase [unclassified Flavobacterium]MDP3681869.1 pantoate--beta-alanine ligase [Flavobacterium sp.]MDZ4329425.1 pantoate--beta-alanine ligase [Flavobacterium sp.]RKS15891.1 pantothenate synthetase [Flavobacterium sp. 120]
MHIFYGKASLIDYLKSIKTVQSTIGFVPTMGALHQGHLALMQKSLLENENTVVSIFVNPTQFNNPEDLAKYPRTLEEDVKKLTALNPNIILYAPSVEDIYDGKPLSQSFDFDGLENQMEGKFRPGHFNGVGTIVKRLFEIIEPTNAYFGEKDFQQLQIVKKMVAKNHLQVNVIGCPIYRESNNLAMSSRNERLSAQERDEAAIIYKTLTAVKEKFATNSTTAISEWVQKSFNKNTRFTLEYFVIADEATLLPCTRKNKNKKYRAFIAVLVNNIRLIDTISLN